MSLIPPWVKWGALAAALTTAFWGGWKVQGWRADARERAATVAANEALTQALSRQASGFAQERLEWLERREAGERAAREAQALAAASRATEAAWRRRFDQLTREAPDACFNLALPDAVFDGLHEAPSDTGTL